MVATGARDVTTGFTLGQRVDSSAGSMTVESLESGRSYEILLLSGLNNETEQVGTRLTVSTTSTTDNVVDAGLGANGTIIAVVSAVAVVVVLAIVVVVVVVLNRRRRRVNRTLDQYGGMEALRTIKQYNKTLAASRGSMRYGDSTTHLNDASQTIVNTVLEVALPGFLNVDYGEAIRPGSVLKSSRSGTVYNATLVDVALSQRIGTTDVAVKEFIANADYSDDFNTDRFHSEVALMWSLSFHPNVIALIAYTDEPRAMITRLYSMDLFMMLHFAEDAAYPLPVDTLLHLAGGMASGLAAIHSLRVAHRDIKTSKILIQAPTDETPFPTAVISDFTTARTASDEVATLAIGSTLRYSSPQVFEHFNNPGQDWSLDEDLSSDVYSLAVVMWEMCERRVPWENQTDIEIGRNVLGGQFLHIMPAKNAVQAELASIMSECFVLDSDARTNINDISARLNGLVL